MQVIDHHIGTQCKRAVCIAIRKVIMERLDTAREATNGNMSVTIEPLKPKEKRTLMTKIICDTHERLNDSQTHFRAFIATGKWMPISHMVTRPFPRGNQNTPDEAEVSLQHCKECACSERCAIDKVIAVIDTIKKEEEIIRLEMKS